jgi:signal transduction histidine kinase
MSEREKMDTPETSTEGSSAKRATAEGNLDGSDAEEKLRLLVAAYETRIDEVADVITRVRHEINNPLTGVLGQAQLLLREELNEKTRKRVQIIEDLAIRMRDIVAQLRHVQKISRN